MAAHLERLEGNGFGGLLRGPTEQCIQVAVHVRHIKSLKWFLVIVPVKEQLYPEPTSNAAAAPLLSPILNNNLSKTVCLLMNTEVALDMHSALDNFQVQSILWPACGMHLCSWKISPE